MSASSGSTGRRTEREVVILNETNLRRVKIRIEGPDRAGKSNATRSISVLAENVDIVRDRILEALRESKR